MRQKTNEKDGGNGFLNNFNFKVLCTFFALYLLSPTVILSSSNKENRVSLIRDAEIENSLKEFIDPLLQVAKLNKEKVRVFVIDDGQVNAFALPSSIIGITSGMLLRSQSLLQIMGVFAHEIGHIIGAHHVRIHDALNAHQRLTLIGMLLGGAAIAAGAGDAGIGLMAGTAMSAQQAFLHYHRGEESAADQNAVNILDKLGLSSVGLLEVMQILSQGRTRFNEKQEAYLHTHPLSSERISFFQNHLAKSPYKDEVPSKDLQIKYERVKIKLESFLGKPDIILKRYQNNDSLTAHYAKAIAYFKQAKITSSLQHVDILIQKELKNPYFYELKGQILFENGRAKEAIPSYQKAVTLEPKNPLLRISLAAALIEAYEDEAKMDQAIEHLTYAVHKENDNTIAWRRLAMAYGKKKEIGMVALCLAENALILRDFSFARSQVERARKIFDKYPVKYGRELLRLKDIENMVTQVEKEKKSFPMLKGQLKSSMDKKK